MELHELDVLEAKSAADQPVDQSWHVSWGSCHLGFTKVPFYKDDEGNHDELSFTCWFHEKGEGFSGGAAGERITKFFSFRTEVWTTRAVH